MGKKSQMISVTNHKSDISTVNDGMAKQAVQPQTTNQISALLMMIWLNRQLQTIMENSNEVHDDDYLNKI